jgi:EAL domain-containing protein (putative c-di-GMP-specific phosphodiesterase class I)
MGLQGTIMTDQNGKLLASLTEVAAAPHGYSAIHIHASGVPTARRSRDTVSRAVAVLNDIVARHPSARLFLLRNFDLVLLARDVPRALLQQVGEIVRSLFLGSAPAVFTNAYGADGEFHTILDLETDLAKLTRYAEAAAGVAVDAGPRRDEARKIDLEYLAKIKVIIQNADISASLFSQPVCRVDEFGAVSVLFHEMYVSIQALQDKYCPGISLASRRWLFADLTEDLDGTVLRTLARPDEIRARKPFSVNLNLATLASETFGAFDRELAPERKQRIVIEIAKADMFENMKLFKEVTASLRADGYKVCLDGLDCHSAQYVEMRGLGIDYAKMFWSDDVASLDKTAAKTLLRRIKSVPEVRFILARCDNAESLRFAKSAGIELAQGRLLDHMAKKRGGS